MNFKERKLLNKVKVSASHLYNCAQIPLSLYDAICKTSYDSSVSRLHILIDLANRFMRNKGYYDLCYVFVEADKKLCYELVLGLPR